MSITKEQAAEIKRLARQYRTGSNGGWPIVNLNELCVYIDSLAAALEKERAALEYLDVPLDAALTAEQPQEKGPDGFATWKDAAVAERVRRVAAEAGLKKVNSNAERFEREWYLRGDQIEALEKERDKLIDVLQRNGFVRCDISSCNCGSWHARYGLPERMQEIKDALADAGHPLENSNGNLVSVALRSLIEELNDLRLKL